MTLAYRFYEICFQSILQLYKDGKMVLSITIKSKQFDHCGLLLSNVRNCRVDLKFA